MEPCPCYPLRLGLPDFPASSFAVGGCFSSQQPSAMCQWQETTGGFQWAMFLIFLESGLQLIALRSRELSVPPLPAIAWEPFAIVYCLIGLCVSSDSFRKNPPQFVIVISRNSWPFQQGQVKHEVHPAGSSAHVARENPRKKMSQRGFKGFTGAMSGSPSNVAPTTRRGNPLIRLIKWYMLGNKNETLYNHISSYDALGSNKTYQNPSDITRTCSKYLCSTATGNPANG